MTTIASHRTASRSAASSAAPRRVTHACHTLPPGGPPCLASLFPSSVALIIYHGVLSPHRRVSTSRRACASVTRTLTTRGASSTAHRLSTPSSPTRTSATARRSGCPSARRSARRSAWRSGHVGAARPGLASLYIASAISRLAGVECGHANAQAVHLRRHARRLFHARRGQAAQLVHLYATQHQPDALGGVRRRGRCHVCDLHDDDGRPGR